MKTNERMKVFENKLI